MLTWETISRRKRRMQASGRQSEHPLIVPPPILIRPIQDLRELAIQLLGPLPFRESRKPAPNSTGRAANVAEKEQALQREKVAYANLPIIKHYVRRASTDFQTETAHGATVV